MPTPDHTEVANAILELLQRRGAGKTICPSEVARMLVSDDSWRSLMEPVRQVAAKLVDDQLIEITQRGGVVDPAQASGAIRLRLITPPDNNAE